MVIPLKHWTRQRPLIDVRLERCYVAACWFDGSRSSVGAAVMLARSRLSPICLLRRSAWSIHERPRANWHPGCCVGWHHCPSFTRYPHQLRGWISIIAILAS